LKLLSFLKVVIFRPGRQKSHYCDVKGINLIHFFNVPDAPLTMPSKGWICVAIFAQGYAGVLKTLLVMVGF
jgi:hypothetical protein